MITTKDLKKIIKARLQDAELLFKNKRYDGAVYLSGYALELQLKLRLCRNLKWTSFPATQKEFEKYASFKTHDLDVLLHLSGKENEVKSSFLAEWSIVAQWNPEARYNIIGTATKMDFSNMIKATKVLLKQL